MCPVREREADAVRPCLPARLTSVAPHLLSHPCQSSLPRRWMAGKDGTGSTAFSSTSASLGESGSACALGISFGGDNKSL